MGSSPLRSGWERLTRTELQIAELVGRGMTPARQGMSWAVRPAFSASANRCGSIPPNTQYVYGTSSPFGMSLKSSLAVARGAGWAWSPNASRKAAATRLVTSGSFVVGGNRS